MKPLAALTLIEFEPADFEPAKKLCARLGYRAERRADKNNPVDPSGFPYQPWLTLEVYE